MNYFKCKKGNSLRAYYFGGNSKAPATPDYVNPESVMTTGEKDRRGRYESGVLPFESLLGETPGAYSGYLRDIESLYPQRRQRASSLESDIYNMIPNANVLSPEFQEEAQNRYNIRKQQGLETFKEMYEPLERQITGKAFQNYGGMGTSAYNDLMARMNDERAEGLAEYVNQLDLLRQQEETQQLANQTQGLQNLMAGQNLYAMGTQELPSAIQGAYGVGTGGTTTYNNLINAINSLALQRASAQNQFNLSNYQNMYNQNLYDLMYNPWTRGIGMGLSVLGGVM